MGWCGSEERWKKQQKIKRNNQRRTKDCKTDLGHFKNQAATIKKKKGIFIYGKILLYSKDQLISSQLVFKVVLNWILSCKMTRKCPRAGSISKKY